MIKTNRKTTKKPGLLPTYQKSIEGKVAVVSDYSIGQDYSPEKYIVFVERLIFRLSEQGELIAVPDHAARKRVGKERIASGNTFTITWEEEDPRPPQDQVPWFWIQGDPMQHYYFYRVGMDPQNVQEAGEHWYFSISWFEQFPLVSFFPGETSKNIGILKVSFKWGGPT